MSHPLKAIMMFIINAGIIIMGTNAQEKISISGKVIDFSGLPVSEATVRIQDADLSDTTDKDGNFSFNSSTGTIASLGKKLVQPNFAALLNGHGRLEIRTSKKTLAGITGFNLSGRTVYKNTCFLNAGVHTFPVPAVRHGVTFLRVNADDRTVYLKAYCPGSTIHGKSQAENSPVTSEILAKSTVGSFNDTIFVTKSGYLEYTLRISKTDISDLKLRIAKKDFPKVTKGSVFTKKPTSMTHSSTILELEDGTLLAAFYGGSSEGAGDVKIYVCRKPPGGEWSSPVPVADGKLPGKNWTCNNPVLFQPYGGDIELYYHVLKHTFWLGRYKTSNDGGKTWSEIKDLGDDKFIGPVKNKPIQLEDGTIISGSSTENNKTGTRGWRAHIERSEDGGKTWEFIGPIPPDNIGAIQPTLMIYPPGNRIQMMCRTYHGFDRIAEAWSEDGGKTWSDLKASVLPNNNSGLDAVTLRDGRQLLTYNHTTRTQSGMGSKARGFLTISISKNGRDWEAALILEHTSSGRYSYPSVIQSRDGLVHVTYTHSRSIIKHSIINPSLLTETVPMPDGKWPTDGPLSLKEYKP